MKTLASVDQHSSLLLSGPTLIGDVVDSDVFGRFPCFCLRQILLLCLNHLSHIVSKIFADCCRRHPIGLINSQDLIILVNLCCSSIPQSDHIINIRLIVLIWIWLYAVLLCVNCSVLTLCLACSLSRRPALSLSRSLSALCLLTFTLSHTKTQGRSSVCGNASYEGSKTVTGALCIRQHLSESANVPPVSSSGVSVDERRSASFRHS